MALQVSDYVYAVQLHVVVIKKVSPFSTWIFNPQRMRCRVTLLVLCACVYICVSVTTLAATHLVYMSQLRCHRIYYGIFHLIVWLSLKMLR